MVIKMKTIDELNDIARAAFDEDTKDSVGYFDLISIDMDHPSLEFLEFVNQQIQKAYRDDLGIPDMNLFFEDYEPIEDKLSWSPLDLIYY